MQEHVKNKHADGVNRKTGADAAPGSESDAPPPSDGGAGPAEAEAAQPKYHVKSPKQMLSEWCQKQKRPAPKYKLVRGGVILTGLSPLLRG